MFVLLILLFSLGHSPPPCIEGIGVSDFSLDMSDIFQSNRQLFKLMAPVLEDVE